MRLIAECIREGDRVLWQRAKRCHWHQGVVKRIEGGYRADVMFTDAGMRTLPVTQLRGAR